MPSAGDIAPLVREFFLALDAYERTDPGRWLNLKGRARLNTRRRDRDRFIKARDELRAAAGFEWVREIGWVLK
jgi:hypothetical protein